MRFAGAAFLLTVLLAGCWARTCPGRKSGSKLICYYGKLAEVDNCFCSHAILPANSDVKAVERARETLKGVKILVTVNEFNQGLVDLLKNSKVDGLEINLKKLDSKNDISEFISTVRAKLGKDLYLVLSVPSRADVLAKYYDFKSLSKHADLFILQTSFLGASKNVTFHPSRLSGMWDMQNTDSVVDLISGLGAPLSKVVISAPVQAFQFTLQDEGFTAPGSPALEVKSLTRNELCDTMNSGNWTLERDEDQAGPYIFSNKKWIAFDDSTSMDIKAKYSRVRGLAGMALKDVSQDGGDKCGPSILEAAYNGLSRQARAPRGAVLHSLEREIRQTSQPLDSVHVSPYRISRVIDVEGKIHAVRQDTRTEFQCSRQGYFVHPRSCNRFYRCVKFDQLVDDFNVFEFDCPAGLAFDERVEVCVWPGSLPHGTPCSGSSEIAPVPKQRFTCPGEQGYYADPENCRWFFACLDHGRSPLTPYEFRCPFGLVFDSERLLCEWPWLVPKCGNGLGVNLASEYVYGGYSTGQGSAVLLDQYNGLGALGAVKLGGVSGRIEQPVVYSNVGTSGLGFNNGGYENQGGYIVGNGLGVGGLGGLSYKATQSLQNAGLLGAGLGGAAGGIGQGSGVLIGQGNLQYSGVGSDLNAGGLGSSQQYQYTSGVEGTGAGINQGNGILIGQGNLQYAGIGSASNAGGTGSSSYQYNSGLGAGISQGNGVLLGQDNLQYSGVGSASNAGGTGSSSYQYNSGLGAGISQGSGVLVGQDNLQYSGVGSASNAGGLGSSEQYQYNAGLAGISGIDAGTFGTRTSAAGLGTQYVASLGSNLEYNGIANTGAFGIKLNQGAGAISQGDLGAVQYHTNLGSNLDYNSGQQLGVNIGNVQGELNTVQTNLGANLVGAKGATSSQSFTQYHGQGQQVLQANIDSKLGDGGANVLIGNAGLDQDGYNAIGYQGTGLGFADFGSKLNQGQILNQGANYNAVTTLGGAKSSQSFTQYHGQTAGQGVAGNINIVGGGYSAVGQSKSGVEINANGESLDTVLHTTASPITVTSFASVPTVTSVPIPALKTATGFESYKGGVVANVPELQYKIQNSAELANISANFVKFASTTPSALLVNNVNQNSGAGATSYSYQSLDSSVNKGGYVYAAPSTVDQGVTISGYSGSSTYRPSVAVVQQTVVPTQRTEGYVYSRPSIAFKEGPAKTVSSFSISSTPRPVTFVQEHVQPVVSVQPIATVQPIQPVVSVQSAVGQPAISTYDRQDFLSGEHAVFGVRQQPIVTPTPQVYVSSTVAPIVQQKVQVQPAVSSYSFTQNVASQGYDYPKPSVAFEERPVVQTYERVQPAVISKFSIRKPTVQPVSTYTVQQPAVIQQNVVQPISAVYNYEQQYKSEGYQYQKPAIQLKEAPVVQPVVSTYHYQQPTVQYGAVQPTYTYQKPAVSTYSYQDVAQKAVGVYKPETVSTYNYAVSSTPKTVIAQTVRPAVVSSYSYIAPTTSAPAIAVQNVEFNGYDYPKPAVSFAEEPRPIVSYENRQPIQEVPFVKKKAYVTGQSNSYQYTQHFEAPAAPVVVENYQAPVKFTPAPVVVQSYRIPTSTPAAPVVVENYQAPVSTYSQSVDTSSTFFNKLNTVSSTPVYQQQFYSTPVKQVIVQTTPKPTFQSTISSVLAAKVQPVTQPQHFYYYDSRLSSTPKTTIDVGYDYPKPQIQFDETPVQPLVPTREYLPSQTSRPISSYSFGSLDTQYQSVSTPRPFTVSTTPLTREYVPVTTKVRVTTPQPVFVVPEISTTAYTPVRSRIRYTTSRPLEVTSLPVSVTTSPIYSPTPAYTPNVEVSSRIPLEVTTLAREYLPVRSRLRVTSTSVPLVDEGYGSRSPARITVIKQNDLHPMLAAKLGAQCTCVTNTLNSRKKQKIIIVEDDEDDDGYVVANNGGKVVENYQYNPDTVEITPTPQIYLQSTTSQTLSAPNPTYAIRKRVRVRPLNSVENGLKNDVSDAEIAGAVRTGLKLVKQAAKEGAEEAINEHAANVRLSDTIDCQRAGLFRHPNQCNKFYACRWDCTKNKFTLHTFNCPVHLTFDNSLGACNWPSQGPACLENTLIPSD